jgi:hypothetical protein
MNKLARNERYSMPKRVQIDLMIQGRGKEKRRKREIRPFSLQTFEHDITR